jgi:hypothetical protein
MSSLKWKYNIWEQKLFKSAEKKLFLNVLLVYFKIVRQSNTVGHAEFKVNLHEQ